MNNPGYGRAVRLESAKGMLDGRLPGYLLQEPIQLGPDLRAVPPGRQLGGNRQSHRAAAIGHGEMAIGHQNLNDLVAMPEVVDENIRLLLQAGGLPGDDLLAQGEDGLAGGDDKDDLLAEFLVQRPDEVVHALEIGRVPLPQLRAGDGVVVHPGRDLGRGLINIPAEPELLDEDANIGVVFQGQCGELLDPVVGQVNRRDGQHIDLAGAQGILDSIVFVRHVPVLHDLRAADRRLGDANVALDAGRLDHLLEDVGHEDVEAMAGEGHPLPLGDRRGELRGGLVGGLCPQGPGCQREQADRHDLRET